MNLKKKHITRICTAIMLAVCCIVSCTHIEPEFNRIPDYAEGRTEAERLPNTDFRKVFIIYSMGFNNLTKYLREDIEDIISGPLMNNGRDALIIFSHNSEGTNYSRATSPVLTRIRKGNDGSILRDTLKTFPASAVSADAGTLNDVLEYIRDNFRADSYGMLLSSHGTGWAPADYCNYPERYENGTSDGLRKVQEQHETLPKPFLQDLGIDGLPAVKSMGVQNISSSEVIEMDITDIADAIPMKMDFIIFDACFMGGIEVAYEMREVCDRMVFSQTEILADGMDYKTMSSYIYNGTASADLEGFCKNYFHYYDSQSGPYRSATISLVDCSSLKSLAEICRSIFDLCRSGIAGLEGSSTVQSYFRKSLASHHKWFYDLEDIAAKAGASQEQMAALSEALDDCVIYKAATEYFMNEIPVRSHCGLSMYLPYKDRTYLNGFYKTLEWNKATGLIQ